MKWKREEKWEVGYNAKALCCVTFLKKSPMTWPAHRHERPSFTTQSKSCRHPQSFTPCSCLVGQNWGDGVRSAVSEKLDSLLFEQSRSHWRCLGEEDEITKCCVTWTLVLRLVQTDFYCTVLWRDWTREAFSVWSKIYVSSISKQRAEMQHMGGKCVQCNWCL